MWPKRRSDCDSYLLNDGYFELLSRIIEREPYVLYLRGAECETPIDAGFEPDGEVPYVNPPKRYDPPSRFDETLCAATSLPVYGLSNVYENGNSHYRPVYVLEEGDWFAHFLYFAKHATYIVMNYDGGRQGLHDELVALLSDACLLNKAFVFANAITQYTPGDRVLLSRFKGVAPCRFGDRRDPGNRLAKLVVEG